MDVDERLSLGWKRNALQALYFGPSNLLDPDESWARITNRMIVAPVVSTLVYENVPVEVRLFFYFRMGNYYDIVFCLFTGAKKVGRWNFKRVVPCHFDAPIKAGPRGVERRVRVPPHEPAGRPARRLSGQHTGGKSKNKNKKLAKVGYYPDEDMVLLRGVGDFLLRTG